MAVAATFDPSFERSAGGSAGGSADEDFWARFEIGGEALSRSSGLSGGLRGLGHSQALRSHSLRSLGDDIDGYDVDAGRERTDLSDEDNIFDSFVMPSSRELEARTLEDESVGRICAVPTDVSVSS